jgi:hypothetical protein
MQDKIQAAAAFFAAELGIESLPVVYSSSGPEKIEAQLRFDKTSGIPQYIEVFVTDTDKIIQNIAHELKHVQQLLSQKLQIRGEKFLWNGQINTEQNYYFQPWEIEARVFSREFFIEFNRFWRENRV